MSRRKEELLIVAMSFIISVFLTALKVSVIYVVYDIYGILSTLAMIFSYVVASNMSDTIENMDYLFFDEEED